MTTEGTGLTISQLLHMAYETAAGNGWHDANAEPMTHTSAYAQLAALTPMLLTFGEVIERIRKPEKGSPEEALKRLWWQGRQMADWGVEEVTILRNSEVGQKLGGTKSQVAAWLVLIISEAIEALEAIMSEDAANFAEELADIAIRLGDTAEAINHQEGHFLAPVDLEAAILAKNERNRDRGYRHGGKRA